MNEIEDPDHILLFLASRLITKMLPLYLWPIIKSTRNIPAYSLFETALPNVKFIYIFELDSYDIPK